MRRPVAGLALAAATVLAACGGSAGPAAAPPSSSSSSAASGSACASARDVATGNAQLGDLFTSTIGPIASSADPAETQRLIDANIPPFAATVSRGMDLFLGSIHTLARALPSVQADVERVGTFTQVFASRIAAVHDATSLTAALDYYNGPDATAFTASLGRVNAAVQTTCGFPLTAAPSPPGGLSG